MPLPINREIAGEMPKPFHFFTTGWIYLLPAGKINKYRILQFSLDASCHSIYKLEKDGKSSVCSKSDPILGMGWKKDGIMGGRIKTEFPGVFYRHARRAGKKGADRVYYLVFKKDGKVLEEKVGSQHMDEMTPKKAWEIRKQIVKGVRLPRQELKKQVITRKNAEKDLYIIKNRQEEFKDMMLEEKWLLFMESATDSFVLLDSELNLVEVNNSTLALLYPNGTRKEDILGKNLLDLVPETKRRGEYQRFLEVLKTGESIIIEDVTFPGMYEDRHFKYKAFKVGNGLGMIISDITDQEKKKEKLRKGEAELKAKTVSLEEANTALKVILKRREEDRKELEEKMLLNVKELIEPYIEKMKNTRLDDSQKAFLDIIESNINDIISPFARGVSKKHLGLTYTELQIANLITHGKTSKEIADLLNLSLNTVQSYRKSIRKKLVIKNKKVNLRTYLSSTS